ncbi:MAG: long-chain fatty acid--CoA ligase [Promethearchaeia archaeon]|nr:MAG: long-chain fatty acid--CoA ligase [Candidatus Lokiarchaeia archaeon]
MREPNKNQICLDRYEELKKFPRMFDWIDRWSREIPKNISIIEYNTGEKINWKSFATATKAFAAKLLAMGLKKGDVVATSLPLLKEHIYLMYACFRIGAIIAPLDLRLKVDEVDQCFEKMQPRAYFTLGKTDVADFRPIITHIYEKYSVKNGGPCRFIVQFQKELDLIVSGAIGISEFAKGIKKNYVLNGILKGTVRKAQKKVSRRDPILIIFTTGSTGYPKPALLCSENILIQNIGLAVAFDLTHKDIMLVNLPPSHVGCTTEQLATTLYGGGTALILHIFNAEHSLDAIQKYKATAMGQIPALFAMEWRLPNYNQYDLSSLRFALYGGQAVTRKFLEQLSHMAPEFGTGLGLTETAGFVTYTPLDGTVDDILNSVGFDMPLCPISIREPMKLDGYAGEEKKPGEVGEICFSGPQIFLGYLNDEENTQKTISKDGILYTGDLGYYDELGLHFSGRAKLLIKPKGYNVFPSEVEEFIQRRFPKKVGNVSVVGVPHEIFTEAIMAFVEKSDPGIELTVEEIQNELKELAAYKRPSHIEILNPGEIPLNRVAKTDYMDLKKCALEIIEKLRAEKKWDAI